MVIEHAEKWIKVAATPLLLKELGWRLIEFVVRCGKSNPISFALRPIMGYRHLKTAVGVNMALMALGIAIFGPFPSLAANTGGNLEIVVASEGEVHLTTDNSVQVPLSNFRVSQRFWMLHSGLDMAAQIGEPVRPVMAGRVVKAEKNWFGYGNMVIVSHSPEYESLYGHLSKILVKEGDEVTPDTVLGLVGSTGRSTGPHLHLEIHENGRSINPAQVLGIK